MSNRSLRLADLVRAELSALLLRSVRDPRVRLATISRVEISRDLGHAAVFVSALGDSAQQSETIAGLESARGYLRRELARRLSLRRTPELRFVLDRGAEHSQQISEILDGLVGDDDHGS